MSTRSSSSSNLVPPFSDLESVIRNRRRNLGDPSLLLDFEEINMNPNNAQGPPPAGPPPQNHNDDIIFGSTHLRYIQLFSDLMKSRFEMSMMGEMMFFLGLQVNQFPCGIFINQSKYVLEILKKYGMESCDPVGTPVEIKDKLDLDQNGTQAKITEKHLKEVKKIFCYLRGTVNMGLWYSKDSSFELTGFLDADYARCKDTFKSTSGGA
nr:uncharacterized mitochondrial protein AtMg00810-like [Tanacetum cinerariifolium]